MGIETLIGAGLSAAGSIFGASQGARAQENATRMALQQQQNSQIAANDILSPYANAGRDIIPVLRQYIDPTQGGSAANILQRLITPGSDQSALLAQTPGYQFNLDQGLRAANNALAARGLGGSGGAAAKAASTFASGLAGNTWQSVVNALQNNFNSGAGALQNYAGLGANAASSLASNLTGTSNNMANNITGLGNAQAGAYNQIGGAIGGLGNNLTQASMLQRLMGGSSLSGGGSIYGGAGTGGFMNNLPGIYSFGYGAQ